MMLFSSRRVEGLRTVYTPFINLGSFTGLATDTSCESAPLFGRRGSLSLSLSLSLCECFPFFFVVSPFMAWRRQC